MAEEDEVVPQLPQAGSVVLLLEVLELVPQLLHTESVDLLLAVVLFETVELELTLELVPQVFHGAQALSLG